MTFNADKFIKALNRLELTTAYLDLRHGYGAPMDNDEYIRELGLRMHVVTKVNQINRLVQFYELDIPEATLLNSREETTT
jgi:hypothetical protein